MSFTCYEIIKSAVYIVNLDYAWAVMSIMVLRSPGCMIFNTVIMKKVIGNMENETIK